MDLRFELVVLNWFVSVVFRSSMEREHCKIDEGRRRTYSERGKLVVERCGVIVK